jgi:predicted MPP superfamily phosphohydrolase
LSLVLLADVVATAAFVVFFHSMRTRPPTRVQLFLGLWPFFAWWSWGLAFHVFFPITWVLRSFLESRGYGSAETFPWVLGFAALVAGWGLVAPPRVREREIPVVDLPEAWDGYRIAQISDLHCGPFASPARVARWVAAVNDLSADLVAVTGDLITHGSHYVNAVAEALGGLRAADGVYACMGNHDYFTAGDEVAPALERAGLCVLRNRGVVLSREGAPLYVAGVDDTWTRRHDLGRALAGRPPEAPTVLLAHDPALFPQAAAAGVNLTLSGHTHGGQLALPLVARSWNLARLITRFTTDLYRLGSSVLYVNRGLGTTGPPLRFGVGSEIALLVLRRAAASREDAPPAPATRRADTHAVVARWIAG